VDRAIQDARYNDARETGVALWGTLGGHKLDWRVMLSNGNGKTQPVNDNDAFLVSGRVMWQALGKARMNQWGSGPLLTEGDLGDSRDGALLAVAAQVSNNDRFDATPATDLKNRTYAIDYTFKYRGFASVADGAWRESRPETGPSFKDRGFLFQASYAWKAPGIPGASFWEVAFRFAQVDPSDIVADNDRREIGGAFSYYYNRHNLKVQADFRNVRDEAANSGEGTSSNELRVQTQISF
jgi:phosphate-selective porin OprO/OprP